MDYEILRLAEKIARDTPQVNTAQLRTVRRLIDDGNAGSWEHIEMQLRVQKLLRDQAQQYTEFREVNM